MSEQRLYLDNFSNMKKTVSDRLGDTVTMSYPGKESERSISEPYEDNKEGEDASSETGSSYTQSRSYSRSKNYYVIKTLIIEEQCAQTSFKDNILHEKYDSILSEGPKECTFGVSSLISQ